VRRGPSEAGSTGPASRGGEVRPRKEALFLRVNFAETRTAVFQVA
jgi:hypothetical protein